MNHSLLKEMLEDWNLEIIIFYMTKEDKGKKLLSRKRRHQERFIMKSRIQDLKSEDEERPGGNDNMDIAIGKRIKS